MRNPKAMKAYGCVVITYFASYIVPKYQLKALAHLPRKHLSIRLSVPRCQFGHGDGKENSVSKHLPVSKPREMGVILTHSRSHY